MHSESSFQSQHYKGDHEFKASLSYAIRSWLGRKKNKDRKDGGKEGGKEGGEREEEKESHKDMLPLLKRLHLNPPLDFPLTSKIPPPPHLSATYSIGPVISSSPY